MISILLMGIGTLFLLCCVSSRPTSIATAATAGWPNRWGGIKQQGCTVCLQMGQIWDFFRPVFRFSVYFRSAKKSPRFVPFGAKSGPHWSQTGQPCTQTVLPDCCHYFIRLLSSGGTTWEVLVTFS